MTAVKFWMGVVPAAAFVVVLLIIFVPMLPEMGRGCMGYIRKTFSALTIFGKYVGAIAIICAVEAVVLARFTSFINISTGNRDV